ncbi:hypothetical protein D9M73_202340 [compost metagenome]
MQCSVEPRYGKGLKLLQGAHQLYQLGLVLLAQAQTQAQGLEHVLIGTLQPGGHLLMDELFIRSIGPVGLGSELLVAGFHDVTPWGLDTPAGYSVHCPPMP